ncbi:MAG: ATP-binding protein [Anaerolineae bacterium]|jgi:signal transduction histidine kinase|nr:ATP-binding protein [Anaerolineae bacterium]
MTAPVMSAPLVEAILADLKVAIAHLDAGLRIASWSADPQARPGWPAANPAGQPVQDVFPELIGSEKDLAAVAAGQADRFELPLINRMEGGGRERRYLSLTALPNSAEPGTLILLVQDVTEEGRLDQQVTQQLNEVRLLRSQLEAANARLVRLDAEKSGFLQMAAHDLRAPLAVVKAYVEYVQEELAQDAEARQVLDTALARIDHMARLIDNLLDVERIESGQVTLSREPLDLAALVEEVVASFAPTAQSAELALDWSVAAGVVHPSADHDLIAQALANLLGNAVKFTPAGGRVAVRAFRQDSEVVVEVEDTGPGIPDEERPKLFQRFWRGSNTRRQQATGLGLSIVKAIAKQHGGRAYCRSRSGQGSTFGFTLPLAEEQGSRRPTFPAPANTPALRQ